MYSNVRALRPQEGVEGNQPCNQRTRLFESDIMKQHHSHEANRAALVMQSKLFIGIVGIWLLVVEECLVDRTVQFEGGNLRTKREHRPPFRLEAQAPVPCWNGCSISATIWSNCRLGTRQRDSLDIRSLCSSAVKMSSRSHISSSQTLMAIGNGGQRFSISKTARHFRHTWKSNICRRATSGSMSIVTSTTSQGVNRSVQVVVQKTYIGLLWYIPSQSHDVLLVNEPSKLPSVIIDGPDNGGMMAGYVGETGFLDVFSD